MDMGSVLTCTKASWWSYMALVCRVGHVTGGATDNHFPFSYSESGVSSLNFHLDRERTWFSSTAKPAAPPGQAGSAPPPSPSKTYRPAVYADYYGAKDATFSADWCACFSVYRELKNASWMPNFGFTIGVYVNIKQVSSLRTTDMTYICTGVWQSWVIIQRLNVALAWTVSSFYLPIWDQTWAKTTHYYHVKCPWGLGHHPVQPVGSVVLPMPRCLSWPCWLSSRSWTEKRWCCSQMPSKKHRKHKQHTRIPPHEPVCRLTIVLFENGGDLCSEMTSTQKYKT